MTDVFRYNSISNDNDDNDNDDGNDDDNDNDGDDNDDDDDNNLIDPLICEWVSLQAGQLDH